MVLLGSTSSCPTIPVSASTIPHVGLKATINFIPVLVNCNNTITDDVTGRVKYPYFTLSCKMCQHISVYNNAQYF